MENERDILFGPPGSGWLWCSHCNRAYPNGKFRADERRQLCMCPYPGCNGDAVLDAWPWEDYREQTPGAPELPQEGKVYA